MKIEQIEKLPSWEEQRKAFKWISGDFIDETDWVHLTKDSKGKGALNTLEYA